MLNKHPTLRAFPLTIVLDENRERAVEWQPQHDITTYELALCMNVLLGLADDWDIELRYETLPQNAKRHFVLAK